MALILNQKDTLFGGRYNVVNCIGAGGMGAVYLATDPRYDDFEVAIKVLYPGIVKTAELRERFKNEIIASYNVLHRNVVRAYEYFDEGDSPAYVMEYVKGKDLHTWCKQNGRFTPDQLIPILHQVAAGLEAIHSAGITHRDLKPDNIFLTDSGLIKIGDFGVARLKSASISVTQTGMMVGTPAYFAPEYVENGECGPQADIYALGVIGYELLANELPFKSQTVTSLMIERVCQTVEPVREKVADCPENLALIIEKAMAVSPENRYQNAGEMRIDLGLIKRGLAPVYATKKVSQGRSTPLAVKGLKNFKKKKSVENNKSNVLVITLLSIILFLLLVLLGVWFYSSSDLLKNSVGIPRGNFQGFMIDGEMYKKMDVERNLSQIFITAKSINCNKAILDDFNMIQCGNIKHRLNVEFSNDDMVAGVLIEEGTKKVRSFKILRRR